MAVKRQWQELALLVMVYSRGIIALVLNLVVYFVLQKEIIPTIGVYGPPMRNKPKRETLSRSYYGGPSS